MIGRIRPVVSAAMLIAGLSAIPQQVGRALAIQDYEALSAEDRSSYLAALVAGAAGLLKAEGKIEMSRSVEVMFEPRAGEKPSPATADFVATLARIREVGAHGDNPLPFHVEHAFALTLQHYDIDVPAGLMTVTDAYLKSRQKAR